MSNLRPRAPAPAVPYLNFNDVGRSLIPRNRLSTSTAPLPTQQQSPNAQHLPLPPPQVPVLVPKLGQTTHVRLPPRSNQQKGATVQVKFVAFGVKIATTPRFKLELWTNAPTGNDGARSWHAVPFEVTPDLAAGAGSLAPMPQASRDSTFILRSRSEPTNASDDPQDPDYEDHPHTLTCSIQIPAKPLSFRFKCRIADSRSDGAIMLWLADKQAGVIEVVDNHFRTLGKIIECALPDELRADGILGEGEDEAWLRRWLKDTKARGFGVELDDMEGPILHEPPTSDNVPLTLVYYQPSLTRHPAAIYLPPGFTLSDVDFALHVWVVCSPTSWMNITEKRLTFGAMGPSASTRLWRQGKRRLVHQPMLDFLARTGFYLCDSIDDSLQVLLWLRSDSARYTRILFFSKPTRPATTLAIDADSTQQAIVYCPEASQALSIHSGSQLIRLASDRSFYPQAFQLRVCPTRSWETTPSVALQDAVEYRSDIAVACLEVCHMERILMGTVTGGPDLPPATTAGPLASGTDRRRQRTRQQLQRDQRAREAEAVFSSLPDEDPVIEVALEGVHDVENQLHQVENGNIANIVWRTFAHLRTLLGPYFNTLGWFEPTGPMLPVSRLARPTPPEVFPGEYPGAPAWEMEEIDLSSPTALEATAHFHPPLGTVAAPVEAVDGQPSHQHVFGFVFTVFKKPPFAFLVRPRSQDLAFYVRLAHTNGDWQSANVTAERRAGKDLAVVNVVCPGTEDMCGPWEVLVGKCDETIPVDGQLISIPRLSRL